jgi:hypothetical protein
MFDRTDEATFRTLVPAKVSGLTILEVSGFRPGERPGFYASAYALATGNRGAYSTHRIICADDHSDGQLHWYFEHGVYDFTDRIEAEINILERRRFRLAAL